MRISKNAIPWTLGVLLLGGSAMVTRAEEETKPTDDSMATEEARPTESYRCTAISMGTRTRGASFINVKISRWSTEEERASILASIGPAKNPRQLYEELQNQEATGTIALQGDLAYDLRYAREFLQDGRRIIIAATERPLAWRELMGAPRSADFNVGLVILDLDPESGEGTGNLSLGTQIRLNEKTNQIEITTGGTQPIQLTKVKRIK